MIQLRPFSQIDPQWKDKKLGASSLTIGTCGCLLTSITMVADAFGLNETPASMNDRMMSIGGFAGVGVRPQFLPKFLPGINYTRLPSFNPPAPLALIDAQLAKGLPAIVKVDYYLDQEGVQDHWIVLVGKQGNDYIVQDPYPIRNKIDPVLMSNTPYGKGLQPQDVIRDVIFFTGPALQQTNVTIGGTTATPQIAPPAQSAPAQPSPATPKKAVPAGALTVWTTEAQLALRRTPAQADDNLIRRLPQFARLTALEAPDMARAKVGITDNWLEVQTDDGAQGFVAAWYVSLEKGAPAAQPAAGSGPLAVFTSVNKLAFRKAPVQQDTNLIRYVPQDTQFLVTEPADAALKKIGQTGQWLNVRAVEGDSGYVAAWFVSTNRVDPALGVKVVSGASFAAPSFSTTSETQPAEMVVRAAEDGLPLYNAPYDRENVPIKRLPLAAELLVIEPIQAAKTKIGTPGQWVQVRDLFGNEGYVDASLVLNRALPEGSEPVPEA